MPTAKKTTTKKTTTKRVPAAAKATTKKPRARGVRSSSTKPGASRAGATAEKKSAVKKAAGTAKRKSAPKKKAPDAAENPSSGLGLVRRCVAALEEKKASGVEVIFLGEKSPVADYYVIATGTSDPHLRALRIELEKAIGEVVPAAHVRVQNEPNSGWCVVDAFDVVVHIFSEEQRRIYALEDLWRDGERIKIGE